MRRTTYALGLVAIPSLLVMACGQSGSGEMEMAMTDVAALRSEIEAVEAKYVEAYNAGDAVALAALYTEDATVQPASGERFVGRSAIEAFRAEEFMESSARDLTVTTLEVGAAGDLAYEIGTWAVALVTVDGEEVEEEGTYVVVLKRTADGSLKLHIDTWSVLEAEMEE